MIAWILALWIGDHPDPFFAPIAAVVALNTTLGERGRNAVRLVSGVVVGIVAGEIGLLVFGGGNGSLVLAVFTAMVAARALGSQPIVVAQAASAAILTVVVSDGQGGLSRLTDALVGAGVALVFSQVLFTPEPVWLLRRAESAALTGMADGLRLTARALADGDKESAAEALTQLRELRDRLAALEKTRAAGPRIARHSVVWRTRVKPAVHEQENAGHLDLLGISALMLTRAALVVEPADGRELAETVSETVDLLVELADSPGDAKVRQHVVDRIPPILEQLADIETEPDSPLDIAVIALRFVSTDVMVFAGVDPAAATTAVRAEAEQLRIQRSPHTEPSWWTLFARRLADPMRRLGRRLAGLLPGRH